MNRMYFGTRERMTWIPCPAIDADLSKAGWAATGRYLNGGGWVRRSATAGKVYRFSWNLTTQAELRKFLDYADGLYGQGPFYFIDPFATENVLPAYWASPRLAALDAPPLVIDQRPELVDTPENTYGYPTKSAVYTFDADDEFAELWIPIPEGYSLHVGVHGSATGDAGVRVTPQDSTPTTPALLGVTTPELTNHVVSGVRSATLSVAGTGTLTLAGVVAALLPDGQPAPTGYFPSGQGHSGCDFENYPSVNGYSAALDKVGATATLIEVGAWL